MAPAKDSEHPQPSSPAQGADYTARVLDALTADPKVWAKTVLFLMYDENDGFFDHVPPPAPPSIVNGRVAGGSTDRYGGRISPRRGGQRKGGGATGLDGAAVRTWPPRADDW